ncbi:MAG: ornithine carbamoyltransferase [Promethearchaeia archaeon]
MKHLLTITDFQDKDSIVNLLNLADNVKKHPREFRTTLKEKCIILLFRKTSTRTRISFQNGIYQLGGDAIYLDWSSTNIHLADLRDEIKSMATYVDMIMARVHEHKTLELMSGVSNIPIINGLSDLYHPCQILADLMTIREKFGSFEDIKISWSGDGNNVCNSLILGCMMLDIPIAVATPKSYQPHQEVIDWVKGQEKMHIFTLTEDPEEAVKEANVIYTDTFVSMGQEEEKEKRLSIFKPYQVNKKLIKSSGKDPYIMHCLPAHRGLEITDEVLDSEKSIVFQQVENRLHLQKAIMLKLMNRYLD